MRLSLWSGFLVGAALLFAIAAAVANNSVRARDLGLAPGAGRTGPLNAITDVASVRVGHVTMIEGDDIRTGATVILPHAGNLYQSKVPAGLAVMNGYGKLAGSTQFRAVADATEETILNSLLGATDIETQDWMTGSRRLVRALPIEAVRRLLHRHRPGD